MRDFFMGAEVEIEELGLGEAPPAVTPPQGVIVSESGRDGWTRKYLYKSRVDGLGRVHPSRILISEIPGDGPQMGGDVPNEHQVPISRPVRVGAPSMGSPLGQIPIAGRFPTAPVAPAVQPNPTMDTRVDFQSAAMSDNRITLPAHTAVPFLRSGPLLGQVPAPVPAAPVAPPAPADTSVPLANATPPPDSSAPAPDASAVPDASSGPLALSSCATAPLQLPDGTIINPDDAITLKDFCAMIPYLEKLLQQNAPAPSGPVRPGGPIPLSTGFPGLPSFGPAAGGFSQGGFGGAGGGGGAGGNPGFGPVGVVTGPTPTGGPGQGTQGPAGPAGPAGAPGVGNIIDGIQKTDGNFENTGTPVIVPSTTFTIDVGGNGDVAFNLSAILSAPSRASGFAVIAGLQIDSTQYILWDTSLGIGAGDDQAFALTISATLFINLPLGTHTISLIYGDNPSQNHFQIVTTPTQPASITAQHS